MVLEYTFLVQEQWFEVPHDLRGLEASAPRLDALVDGEAARERLRGEVERMVLSTEPVTESDRHTWAGVGDRAVGAISAVMTVEPVRARGVDLDQIVELWSHAEWADGMDTWLWEFRKTELAGRPAVSGHHIVRAPADDSGERALSEVYRAAISAPELSTYMVMTITTNDLTVFDDIVGYGDLLAGTFEFARVA